MIVNGSPATQLDIADRATQYGDGCFTTMLVKNGKVEHWEAHLTRLQASRGCLAKVILLTLSSMPFFCQSS